jgi:hypothetical protein
MKFKIIFVFCSTGITLMYQTTRREVGSSGNISYLCSGGARFEPRSRHLLSGLRIFRSIPQCLQVNVGIVYLTRP